MEEKNDYTQCSLPKGWHQTIKYKRKESCIIIITDCIQMSKMKFAKYRQQKAAWDNAAGDKKKP